MSCAKQVGFGFAETGFALVSEDAPSKPKADWQLEPDDRQTTIAPAVKRYNTKPCKCGTVTSLLASRGHNRLVDGRWKVSYLSGATEYYGWISDQSCIVVPCRSCGSRRVARPVRGTYRADRKCDARCLNAKGHVCECQCGGKNHGGGYSV